MAQRKNYWYVLVLTDYGPVFVTGISYADRTAHWDKLEKPLLMDKSNAQDLALGLNCNLYTSYAVCQPFELDCQPYLYNKGQFTWKFNEDTEEENNE